MKKKKPLMSCIVIGINASRTIISCLKSIKSSNYKGDLEIIYVDGGSRDNSIELAKSVKGVKVIELKQKHPTPGRGRNAGWKIASGELIQFLDADMILEKDWLEKSVNSINDKTIAVCGLLKELYPNKNWYHFVSNFDFSLEIGNTKYLEGAVLIKKFVLKETAGYNEKLIAGEESELSFRIRRKGYSIKRLNRIMCYHDINMNSFKCYFKRCYRSGYGYIQVGLMFSKKKDRDWIKKVIKRSIKTTGTLVFLGAFLLVQNLYFLIIPLLLNIMPIIKIPYFKKIFKLSNKQSIIYGLHLVIAAYPLTLGVYRYFIGKIFNWPLTNKIFLRT